MFFQMFSSLELRFPGDKVRSICDQLSVMEDLVLINHVRLPDLVNILSYTTLRHLNICVFFFVFLNRTMALVPQESSLNSNRTLYPSVCLGPHVGSSRVVLSGCTVGQVEAGVVTTIMVPSAEQTDTREGQTLRLYQTQGGSQSWSM